MTASTIPTLGTHLGRRRKEMAMTLTVLIYLSGVVWSTGTPEAEQPEIRLVNGSSRCTGRVEVLHNGVWGTVCDDSWGIEEAQVVCQQLGCAAAITAPQNAFFGKGEGQIWLDELNCTGAESALSQCPARPWGENDCYHGEDAGVICSEPPEIRLANGPNKCSGRVEILHNETWGTACDDSWDLNDAKVVCQYLGCGTAISAPQESHFGQGTGPIWLDDVNCTGTETKISTCPAKAWGKHDCFHGEDASVVCAVSPGNGMAPHGDDDEWLWREYSTTGLKDADIRLVNGSSSCSGRVEIFHNRKWGTICDDSWGIEDAEVVCRQLGCGAAQSGYARFGGGTDPIWLDEVQCSGTESAIIECPSAPWGHTNCNHEEDAGVVCSEPTPTIQHYLMKLEAKLDEMNNTIRDNIQQIKKIQERLETTLLRILELLPSSSKLSDQ